MKRWTEFVKSPEKLKEGGILYSNNRYHVIVHLYKNPIETASDIAHLSIRNNDRSAKRDWRDFQRIKNEFLGPEHEAVEIYPAETQLTDTANQFHIWAYLTDPTLVSKLSLGFRNGRTVWNGVTPLVQELPNVKQRPINNLGNTPVEQVDFDVIAKQHDEPCECGQPACPECWPTESERATLTGRLNVNSPQAQNLSGTPAHDLEMAIAKGDEVAVATILQVAEETLQDVATADNLTKTLTEMGDKLYKQAEDRINRPKLLRQRVVIHDMSAEAIDQRIAETLESKEEALKP